jgi:NDP-sugar pyrophosphorylase family protein
MDFDFEDMLQKIQVGGYAGAVPSYTGFHPHLIHKKVYGGVLADQNNTMLKYEEKRSFTENPMESHHSAGAYYFRSGKDFKEYSNELMSRDDIRINGEAYTSMIYYLYLRDGKKIYVPEPKYFMQWGTPEDLEEYEAWMRYMSSKHNVPLQETSIPLGREVKVAIPYREDTEQFIKSHEYWENYFKEKLCK